MIVTTIAGRVGKDAETRTTQGGTEVTSWSVAVDTGWGDNKRTLWFDCSMWGQRGAKVAPYITKGSPITVTGELGTREHNGKTYLTIRVQELALQGGGRSSSPVDNPAGSAPAAPAGGDWDDEIPFSPEWR